jgi:DNA-binding transcriptional ArsR family regulator
MTKKLLSAESCCPPAEECCAKRPELRDRPLLTFIQAVKVMALFKLLANDTRLRLVHYLIRSGEASVGNIAKTLGMKQQAVSNQLQRLSDTKIVASRREGNSIYYRIQDKCVPVILDKALCVMEDETAGSNQG